ncbi:MAG TPA: hypothetical protein VF476_11715, partial [Chitinophagaceae bacterium]
MATNVRHSNLGRKLFRILLKSVLFLLLFVLILVLLVHTPPAQRFIKKKLVAYLERELKTEVSIGKIYIGLPKYIVAEDVYIEDRQQDTLVSAGKLEVDIALLRLAFKKE